MKLLGQPLTLLYCAVFDGIRKSLTMLTIVSRFRDAAYPRVAAAAVTQGNEVRADPCSWMNANQRVPALQRVVSILRLQILNFFQHRLFRFLMFGGSAAAVNVVLMYVLVNLCDWNSIALRNLANVISVELSLIYSFVVYRLFVWNESGSTFRQTVSQQLVRYHGSAGAAIVVRAFLLFPALDYVGVNHLINTVIGALCSCLLNYTLASRYVFASEKSSQ